MENKLINPLLDIAPEPGAPYLNPLAMASIPLPGISIAALHEKYNLNVHPKAMNDPQIKAIADSGKKVKELTQEELRVVYHFISGTVLNRVFSASTINHIARKGKYPEYDDLPEGDSLFIGDQVHQAMEVKGKNLAKLATYSEIGEEPIKPELEVTPDNLKILRQRASGINYVSAYISVKSNKTIDDVDPAKIIKWENDEEYEPSKPLAKLINAAKKESDKIETLIPEYSIYLKKMDIYEKKKEKLRASGKIILDDLSYRAMGADRMKATILGAYKALQENSEVMNTYWKGYASGSDGLKIESLTEFVILWEHEYKPGKTVACKSMLDKLHLDHTNKVAIIQDIKTHSRLARQFVSTNYFEYGYYRSMSFYAGAVRSMLKERGEDVSQWKVYAILLPVSTSTFEVGCFNPVVGISEIDLLMGKDGGYMKPIGTKFNIHGLAQWGLDQHQFDNLAELGLIHRNAYEYYIKGWKQVIEEHESASRVPGLRSDSDA
ncbi:MAG: hypothetical protein PF450_10260 [Bacteroidales bacterium]|jgi:hypothetical protein|nr:hypothetical protein [Bacteroidales bacterium]